MCVPACHQNYTINAERHPPMRFTQGGLKGRAESQLVTCLTELPVLLMTLSPQTRRTFEMAAPLCWTKLARGEISDLILLRVEFWSSPKSNRDLMCDTWMDFSGIQLPYKWNSPSLTPLCAERDIMNGWWELRKLLLIVRWVSIRIPQLITSLSRWNFDFLTLPCLSVMPKAISSCSFAFRLFT
jgi:hypothetical protein